MAGETLPTGTDKALDAITGRATVNSATTYACLLTANLTDTSTTSDVVTNEVTTAGTNGYSRQAVTWTVPADSSGARITSNSGALTFGPFSADLANVTHVALVEGASGTPTALRAVFTLDTPRNPANGDSIQLAANALSITLD